MICPQGISEELAWEQLFSFSICLLPEARTVTVGSVKFDKLEIENWNRNSGDVEIGPL